MKGVQCYELFGGIALKNHAFSYFFSWNKRYLNTNAHQDKDKFWNLGMVAISGRMTAENTLGKK